MPLNDAGLTPYAAIKRNLHNGHAKVGFGITPWEMSVSNSLWGSRLELMELVQMAERQPLEIRTVPFPPELAPMAYQMLHERKIDGRAVVVP